MSEVKELKPCPFCGGESVKIFIGNEYTKKRSIKVKCKKCRVNLVNAALIHSHEWLDNVTTESWNERIDKPSTEFQAALEQIANHNGCSAVLKKIASDALEVRE